MKLVLEFLTEKNKVPLEYRAVFMHFLKSCLNGANDGKYYDNYYEETKTKNFSFAVFFDAPKFGEKQIELSSNRVKMLFTTSEELTGLIFYSSFLEKKRKKLMLKEGNSMILKSITRIAEPEIKNGKIIVKMNSPLVIRNHNRETNRDFYYSYSRETFEEEALRVIKNQLEQEGYRDTYLDGLGITPVKCKKVIVKHYQCNIEASVGSFMLEGNPAVLTYLMQAGIGSRKSEGFGMMELLTENV